MSMGATTVAAIAIIRESYEFRFQAVLFQGVQVHRQFSV